jgi:hypothetical protein
MTMQLMKLTDFLEAKKKREKQGNIYQNKTRPIPGVS